MIHSYGKWGQCVNINGVSHLFYYNFLNT